MLEDGHLLVWQIIVFGVIPDCELGKSRNQKTGESVVQDVIVDATHGYASDDGFIIVFMQPFSVASTTR